MAEELFGSINFNSLQDGEPIDISEVNTEEKTETEEVEVETPETTAETETQETKEETKTEETKAEEKPAEDLLEIETETVTTSEEETETPGQEESSPITPFASLLHEKGFLSHTKAEEIKDIEGLIEAFQKEKQAYQQDVINSFPEELVGLAKAVSEGIPFDTLKDAKVAELKYNSISEDKLNTDTNLQKRLVQEYLTEKGFKPEKINRYIEKYEDMGDLEVEAKDALVELKEMSSKKEETIKAQYAEQQRAMEEENKKLVSDIEKRVTDTKEILPGRQLSEDMRKKTLGNMLNIVGQDQAGNPMNGIMMARSKDPVEFDMNVAYLLELTNNFTDWSAVKTTAKTSAAKEFEEALKSSNTTSIKSGKSKKLEDETDVLNGLKYI